MKAIGKLIGWLWVIIFLSYIIATLYQTIGNVLPDNIEHYRKLFQRWVESFLFSWTFGVVLIVGWLFVSYRRGRTSGWYRLAQHYVKPMGAMPSDLRFNLGSGRVGKAPYSISLKISGYRLGLIVKMLLPFRFGNPSLYIPWNSIKKITLRKSTSPDKQPGVIERISRRFSRSQYAQIQLIKCPNQVLIVPWNDKLEKLKPETLELEREDNVVQ